MQYFLIALLAHPSVKALMISGGALFHNFAESVPILSLPALVRFYQLKQTRFSEIVNLELTESPTAH